MDELKYNADSKPGFTKAMWCAELACEDKIKEETATRVVVFHLNKKKLQQHVFAVQKKLNKWFIGRRLTNSYSKNKKRQLQQNLCFVVTVLFFNVIL
ncbi:MAG: hypothetical protein ACRCST_05700 [Turicibacter sp.]